MHTRGGGGGGGTSQIESNAQAGGGVRGGGGGGGGSGGISGPATSTGGVALITDSGGFRRPLTEGSPNFQWSTGDSTLSDNVYLTAASGGLLYDYNTFEFGIPLNNTTITGIEVKIEAASTGGGAIGMELSWNGGSSVTSSGNATPVLTTTDTVYTLGGPSNTWGRSWTPSEINSGLAVQLTSGAGGQKVDAVFIKVYYQSTGGGGGGGQMIAVPSNHFFANVYSAFGSAVQGLWSNILSYFFGWFVR